jgi:hypothetical protein
MSDRMKHRFSDHLGIWFKLLWEMGVITKKELDDVLNRVANEQADDKS